MSQEEIKRPKPEHLFKIGVMIRKDIVQKLRALATHNEMSEGEYIEKLILKAYEKIYG